MAQLNGRTILIVEDECLQAVDLMAALQSGGAQVIAAQTMEDAISAAQQNRISAAVLDIKLQDGRDCAPICHFLSKRRVPFIFHTAYTKHDMLDEFPTAPVLAKPASKADLLERIVKVLRNGSVLAEIRSRATVHDGTRKSI